MPPIKIIETLNGKRRRSCPGYAAGNGGHADDVILGRTDLRQDGFDQARRFECRVPAGEEKSAEAAEDGAALPFQVER